MKLRKYFSPSLLLTVAFVLSVFLLFFIASISFKQIKTMSETQQSITHSLDVRVDLERLFSELKDAESANRAYLLTGDERYLQPYDYSHVSINKSLIAISRKIGLDKKRKDEFEELYRMINERFKAFRDSRIQGKKYKPHDPEFLAEMWRGKLIMDKIRMQINRIVEKEGVILSAQQAEHEDEITFTPFTSSFLVIFSIAIFVITFFTLKSNLKHLSSLNQKLKLTNRTFENAERIGQTAHWQYDTKKRELVLSDNRYRLLAADIGGFPSDVETFLKFVHPSDRKKVEECFDKSRNLSAMTVNYRVIRADKKTRYFSTTSQLMQTRNGSEIIIGIDRDVTSQHRSTIKLEQKNDELRSTNSELSSFNHIVSHDLQEPMRKIQMFISRIDEKDLENVSETSRSYLFRIQSSANRAQKLIDDLLVYTRLNRNDKRPELTDLNELLNNAKVDMAQAIEEKQALIVSDKLPTIKVTPYQIEQLFVNLISNSIKYARENVRPEIGIIYSLVDASEIPDSKKPAGKKFHKIAFSDNGIGFEPEYKNRIFVLFNRLHDKEQYSGTGIGLAICKKMAESHGGYIFADGRPGQGATFTLYLPATP
ncbi:CHASE3 domain-containing protein [Flavobacterium sp. MAH-1]|uniref:histidine kinase n=1 Tax=Flavobacterium agri TaxID=2743471 RepID=A0A7Y8XYV4_9FLAO|nr:CHASE3 domain-containing protein [Flavobacterium agri]NUY79437.1 CHASE3 domain-containing protein [Flavobacterium agri]NYA69462.1 CHASE3 domain-containing protein [Flavobacterium agri]